MIKVQIRENDDLVAICKLYGPDFDYSLAAIKRVDLQDRDYSDETKLWTITNPERYIDQVPEIGQAIHQYRMQLRMF